MRAFRIGLGLVVLADLVTRLPTVELFMTDSGLVPREDLLRGSDIYHWSFHLFSGALWWQLSLMILQSLLAGALILNIRPQASAFALWLFTISLTNRNASLTHSGDTLLILLLLWAALIPHIKGKAYSGFASFGLIAQIIWPYLEVATRRDDSWWSRGTAGCLALSSEQWATGLGGWLSGFPELIKTLTIMTMYFEAFGPILILIGAWLPRLRLVVVCSFIVMHIVFGLTLRIGIFPLVSIVSWLPLIPSIFWERLSRGLSNTKNLNVITEASFNLGQRIFLESGALLTIIAISLVNWPNMWGCLDYRENQTLATARKTLALEQQWRMFAPHPILRSGTVNIEVEYRGVPSKLNLSLKPLNAELPTHREVKFWHAVTDWPQNYRDQLALRVCQRYRRKTVKDSSNSDLNLKLIHSFTSRDLNCSEKGAEQVNLAEARC